MSKRKNTKEKLPKIEKGIEPPYRPQYLPILQRLEIGDSFVLENKGNQPAKTIRTSLLLSAKRCKPPIKISVKKLRGENDPPNSFRVWRVE